MNFYMLDDPAAPAEFARFSHVGTWVDDRVCDLCGEPTARLVEPLQIEWEEGTDRIGDFSWCGYHCIVLDPVREFIEAGGFECTFGRVEVMQPTQKATRPRVSYPYRGPRLSWLIPQVRVSLNSRASGLKLLADCAKCGQQRYTFRRENLVITRNSWHGEKIFLIDQFGRSRATFITEVALAALIDVGFANLSPLLAGRIES